MIPGTLGDKSVLSIPPVADGGPATISRGISKNPLSGITLNRDVTVLGDHVDIPMESVHHRAVESWGDYRTANCGAHGSQGQGRQAFPPLAGCGGRMRCHTRSFAVEERIHVDDFASDVVLPLIGYTDLGKVSTSVTHEFSRIQSRIETGRGNLPPKPKIDWCKQLTPAQVGVVVVARRREKADLLIERRRIVPIGV